VRTSHSEKVSLEYLTSAVIVEKTEDTEIWRTKRARLASAERTRIITLLELLVQAAWAGGGQRPLTFSTRYLSTERSV
jgi:hypothetical protein